MQSCSQTSLGADLMLQGWNRTDEFASPSPFLGYPIELWRENNSNSLVLIANRGRRISNLSFCLSFLSWMTKHCPKKRKDQGNTSSWMVEQRREYNWPMRMTRLTIILARNLLKFMKEDTMEESWVEEVIVSRERIFIVLTICWRWWRFTQRLRLFSLSDFLNWSWKALLIKVPIL